MTLMSEFACQIETGQLISDTVFSSTIMPKGMPSFLYCSNISSTFSISIKNIKNHMKSTENKWISHFRTESGRNGQYWPHLATNAVCRPWHKFLGSGRGHGKHLAPHFCRRPGDVQIGSLHAKFSSF